MSNPRASGRVVLTAPWILAFGLALAFAVQLAVVQETWPLDTADFDLIRCGAHSSPIFEICPGDPPTWPLVGARAKLEYSLFGLEIRPRVLFNLALHLGAALLLFLCVRAWLGEPRSAAWAAVLFAAHPLHAEVLAWHYSGEVGMTATVPTLLTLWLFASRRHLVLALGAFQVALLSGLGALCVPLFVTAGLAARAPRGDRSRRAAKGSWPYWALLAANLWWLWPSLHGAGPHSDALLTAGLAALAHPWLPIHPGLELRVVWWCVFAAIPFGLVRTQRDVDTTALRLAAVAYALAALPLAPWFHEAHRFLHAAPGGYTQQWSFFYLPLAALCVWPAYVIRERDLRDTGYSALALAALCGLFLVAQGFNARWWVQRAEGAREASTTLRDAAALAPAVGIVARGGSDAVVLSEEAARNLHTAWPAAMTRDEGTVRVFRDRESGDAAPVLEELHLPSDEGGRPTWGALGPEPASIVWLVWSPGRASLVAAPAPAARWMHPRGRSGSPRTDRGPVQAD